ncbi:MAG: hypothetical protein K0R82_61 [Flavipsychrobacter sp.]|nr:hypothetical protein [Flavipsychrobacter sp.]
MNDKGLRLREERFYEPGWVGDDSGVDACGSTASIDPGVVVVEKRQQTVTISKRIKPRMRLSAFCCSATIPNPTTNAVFFQLPSNRVKKANKLQLKVNIGLAFSQYHFAGIVTGYGRFNSTGRAMSINNSTHNEYAIPQYVIGCSSAVNCCNRKRLLKYNGCFNILDRGKKRKCLICNKIVSQAAKSAPSWPGQKYGVSVAEQGLAGFLSYRYWNK